MCLRIEIKVLLAVVWIYLPYNCAYCYSPLAFKHLIRSVRFPNTPFIVTKRGKQTWLFTSVLIVKWFDKTPFRYNVLERCALIYTHITKYRWSPRSWKFLLAEKVSANTCQYTLVLWKTCPDGWRSRGIVQRVSSCAPLTIIDEAFGMWNPKCFPMSLQTDSMHPCRKARTAVA